MKQINVKEQLETMMNIAYCETGVLHLELIMDAMSEAFNQEYGRDKWTLSDSLTKKQVEEFEKFLKQLETD